MISFKEFLAEARMAPLYHGTDKGSALSIIITNAILGHRQLFAGNMQPPGVSLTRNFNVAKKFSTLTSGDPANAVIFELDQQKLTHNYKIRPFNFFADKTARFYGDKFNDFDEGNEYEEFVPGNIKNVDRYITKVILLVKPGKPLKGNVILNHPKLYYNGKFVNK